MSSIARQTSAPVTHHHHATVDGIDIFYREAGPAEAPVVVLLHGFPTSSHPAFLRDLPKAELHRLDTGHFALEDKADEMVPLIRGFLGRHLHGK